MIEGTTSTGFAFSISEEALNNMELLDAMAEMRDGDHLSMSKICLMLLGPEQRQRLYDHLRGESGNVPIDAVSRELMEIFNAKGAGGKN